MIKERAIYQRERERTTKQIRVAKVDYNHEERMYYNHSHNLEGVKEQVKSEVEVVIDVAGIVQMMAKRAARNGSGKALTLGGLVKAKRLSETVLSSEPVHTPISKGYSEVTEEERKAAAKP